MFQTENTVQVNQNLTTEKSDQSGFSLIEAIIALMILTIALLSVVMLFSYATKRNTGNNLRSQALAILQQEVEQLRAAKFTPQTQITDAILTGGTKNPRTVSAADNSNYQVKVTVDDNPATANTVEIDTASTLKEITVEVTIQNSDEAWVKAVPTKVVFRRVRSN